MLILTKTTIMNFKKNKTRRSYPVILILLLVLPMNSFSQENSIKNTGAEQLKNEITNGFIAAVNRGDRNSMEKFILQYYDDRALRMLPIATVVSLNLSFYYETGGSGYDLLEIEKTEGNKISFLVQNRLTNARIKFNIPTSGPPHFAIN